MSCHWVGSRLTAEQETALRKVAAEALDCRERRSSTLSDGSEIYAYPHPGGGIAWGVNSAMTGFCIARGVCDHGEKLQ